MKNEIQSKINEFLAQKLPFSEESEVVYLMVEIRKIIEHNDNNKYLLLKFYCDWTVHTQKDRITKIMKKIMDEIYRGIKYELEHPALIGKTKTKIIGFMYMEDLQEEMNLFLKHNNIKTDIVQKDNWLSFVKTFVKILENQPIVNPTDNIKSLRFYQATEGCVIGKVEFVKKEAEFDFYEFGNTY